MSGTVSGSTGRRILVLGGRIVLNLGAGITRVSAGSVVCSTAGGGKGMAFCSCGSCECGLAGSLVVKMYIIIIMFQLTRSRLHSSTRRGVLKVH